MTNKHNWGKHTWVDFHCPNDCENSEREDFSDEKLACFKCGATLLISTMQNHKVHGTRNFRHVDVAKS